MGGREIPLMLQAPHEPEAHVREGTVLLVSADRPWMASTTAFLVSSTRSLSTAETASEALRAAMDTPPDVAVIAPPLGEGSPLPLISQLALLRDNGPIGIVYVAERERAFAEHTRLMKAGANDWFPRGLSSSEAAKRIAALVNEIRSPENTPIVSRGPLVLDRVARRAVVDGVPVALAAKEYLVLDALARSVGQVMWADDIIAALGMRRSANAVRSIEKHMDALREKLGGARGLLETSRRNGYRLRFVAPL